MAVWMGGGSETPAVRCNPERLGLLLDKRETGGDCAQGGASEKNEGEPADHGRVRAYVWIRHVRGPGSQSSDVKFQDGDS